MHGFLVGLSLALDNILARGGGVVPAGTYIITEAGDYLTTEAGDKLITE